MMSTHVDAAALAEEVRYWRRDLSARLWFATGLYEAALRDGRLDEATTHEQAIRSGLAAFRAVDAGEFHSRCEACGEFILPGEARAGNEDISGHARCLIEDAQDEPRGPDDTEADLRARVIAAEVALALPWPEDDQDAAALPPAGGR